MNPPALPFIPTRYSLLSRLQNWEDQESWRDFFETYWRLIYSLARKSGLTDSEAQDVVQETVLSVAKNLHKFKRDRTKGTFKGWLRNIIRWRIADQLRRRECLLPERYPEGEDSAEAAILEREDPNSAAAEAWEEEWRENLLLTAVEKVRSRVREEHYQVFDLYVVRGWPIRKVAETLGVGPASIYVIKHRVSRLVRIEIEQLKKEWL